MVDLKSGRYLLNSPDNNELPYFYRQIYKTFLRLCMLIFGRCIDHCANLIIQQQVYKYLYCLIM